MPSQSKNYYAILEVPIDADPEQIKKAYRRLALENHPDKSNKPGATQRFQDINEAHEVLSNPSKRRVYDLGRGDIPSPKAQSPKPKAQSPKPKAESPKPSFYKDKKSKPNVSNEFKAPLDSIYDIEKLSRQFEEDAKKYYDNSFHDGYGYRVTSKWRLDPGLSNNFIYLSKLNGDDLAENCKIMGSFVRMSFEEGFHGNIHFKIAFGGPMDSPSNILMLLKLGMIPAADQSYLKLFGSRLERKIREALTALIACKKPDELSDDHCKALVEMITLAREYDVLAEKSISENITEAVITKEVLFQHKDILFALQSKEIISPTVIADILKAVARFGDSKYFPLPPELINVSLIMSEEGIKRWKTAIEENKSFQPFAFEHLEPLMSEAQIEKLSTEYPKYRSTRQESLTRTINHFFKDAPKVPSTNSVIEDVIVGYTI